MASNPPSKGPQLQDLQKWFADLTRSEGSASPGPYGDLVRETDQFDRQARISVYNRGYFLRLAGALSEDYPVLKAIVGEDDFYDITVRYVSKHPSTSPSLNELGKNLPEFLTMDVVGSKAPALADLARLEWKLVEAFYADSAESISEHALALLTTHSPDQLQLLLDPSVALIESAWPLDEIYQQEKLVTESNRRFFLVHKQGDDSHFLTLPEWQYQILSKLLEGKSLGVALADWAEKVSDEFTSEQIQAAFKNWLGLGIIGNIVLA